MPLFFSSLNSGSNGNCYYVGNHKEAVLIDAGISCRETEKRMNRLGLSMEKVKAIFISHEHNDHINGLKVLSKKFQLPVYITKGTQAFGHPWVEKHLVKRFKPHEDVLIGDLRITPFPKFHDAGDPHSFVVSSAKTKVGVFTDIGVACPQVIRHFKNCHAAFLESNYDEDMLMNGSYPYYLKKRISDGRGHLSNTQALDLFLKHRPSFMTHLLLSHLSKNNNSPEIVNALFSKHALKTEIVIASRYEETKVYQAEGGPASLKVSAIRKEPVLRQLSLFQ